MSYWDFLKSRSYQCTIHYIDDVFTLNNSKFDDKVDLIYSIELELKYTTDIARCTSYIDQHIDNDSEGQVRAKLKDKRDDLNLAQCTDNLYVATYLEHLYIECLCIYLPAVDEHGCVTFVLITIRSFPHSWLITRFVKRVNTTDVTSAGDLLYHHQRIEFTFHN